MSGCPGMSNVAECKMWKVTMCEIWWCGIVAMKNVTHAMCCVIVARRQMWRERKKKKAMSNVVV